MDMVLSWQAGKQAGRQAGRRAAHSISTASPLLVVGWLVVAKQTVRRVKR